MGFISVAKEKQQTPLPVEAAAPARRTFVVDQTRPGEESPLKNRIAASYDRYAYQQQTETAKDALSGSQRIVHSETETRIYTVLDTLLDLVRQRKQAGVKALAKELSVEPQLIEYWTEILEKQGYVKVTYPVNIFADALVTATDKRAPEKERFTPAGMEQLDSYTVSSDHVVARITLWGTKTQEIPTYQIIIPEIGEGTEALMHAIIKKISVDFNVELDELTEKKKKDEMTVRFFEYTKELLAKKLPKVQDAFIEILTGTILHRMYGLNEMEILMGDNWIEEIAINGSQAPVSVYHKKFGWVKTTLWLGTEEEIYNFASRIGRNVGREINSLNPIMDAHLTTGDRVAATLFPISTGGNTITIRRFARNPWTIVNMIDPQTKTMSVEIAALLWLALQYELNVIVAGGTASGKTSVLNSIVALSPPKQRMISIEDTREIFLPKDLHWNWVPMTTRKANPEGKGEITMLDLMVASLRMRPDRIVVGEIRRKEQAEALFETMHTGHSVYGTMHADTVEQVQRRLLEPPIAIPKTELGALHLILVQYRDRRKGSRRTLEIAEILSADGEESGVQLNYLYRWRPRTDTFEKINESIRVVQELNLHTGMTNEEIRQDLEGKQQILLWLVKHQIKDVDKVGRIMKLYYTTPEMILEAAANDVNPFQFFTKEDLVEEHTA